MSDSMLGDDPQKTARDLQRALEGMTEQLTQVKATLRRGKRVAAAIAVSLVLDVALTIGVSITAVQAGDASAKANATVAQLHSTQVSACRSGNQTRAEEVALWTHLASLSATSGRTPAQRKADDQLLAYIRSVFKPRDCTAVYKLRAAAAAAQRGR
jgi:hypothetical protein